MAKATPKTGARPTRNAGAVTDRNLALELVRVTEAAALAASKWIGLGKKNEADGAAVEAMRKAFDTVEISGTVVIGEGEMDEAPMLYIGEKVGAGGPRMDIAVDPLEGTTLTSKGGRVVKRSFAESAPNGVADLVSGSSTHAPPRPRRGLFLVDSGRWRRVLEMTCGCTALTGAAIRNSTVDHPF